MFYYTDRVRTTYVRISESLPSRAPALSRSNDKAHNQPPFIDKEDAFSQARPILSSYNNESNFTL